MTTFSLVRGGIALLACSVAAGSARGQNYAGFNKELRFIQTGPSTVIADSQAAFQFSAFIQGTATNPAPPNSFALPNNGLSRSLTFRTDDGWSFDQSFTSQAALTSAFPNGTYQLLMGGRTVSIPFTGDLYPSAPVATLSAGTFSNGALVVDRAVPLTITIAFNQNHFFGFSRLAIDVSGNSLELGTNNGNFTQTPLSFTIPANTFVAGGNYSIELQANRFVTIDPTSAPGFVAVALYSATNRINVTVAGVATPPTFASQPSPQNVAAGSTVVFNAPASGATSYQWRRDGVNLPGAQSATLVLSGTGVVTGDYSVVAGNAVGTTTSNPARLFATSATDFGRLINLSILSGIRTAGDSFTLGYVVGGAGTSGAKPLVLRAGGPSLGAFGVPGTLVDPRIELFAGSTKTGENDNWGGAAALTSAFVGVGAFPYTSPTSLDAAALASITTRDNSVKVSATGAGTGTVIAEVYDATPAGTSTAATPRLLNVSVLKVIDPGDSLTAGFVIRGQTARTVLIRAIGPGLAAAFSIPGTMPDPQLTLFTGSTQIAQNDNWGGNFGLSAGVDMAARVGAFVISDSNSRDAMLLRTLAPGDYSARVSGVGGAGGTVIVEVYEVP